MDQKVRVFLESDRQWTRANRISHAQYQLQAAKTDEDKAFWKSVLEANQGA